MDAAGMTREDVATDTLHEEFDHYHQWYEHMQEVIADAQRVVSDDEWLWYGGDDLPESALDGGITGRLQGMDSTNGYYLPTARI